MLNYWSCLCLPGHTHHRQIRSADGSGHSADETVADREGRYDEANCPPVARQLENLYRVPLCRIYLLLWVIFFLKRGIGQYTHCRRTRLQPCRSPANARQTVRRQTMLTAGPVAHGASQIRIICTRRVCLLRFITLGQNKSQSRHVRLAQPLERHRLSQKGRQKRHPPAPAAAGRHCP